MLLDTHMFLWWLFNDARLPSEIKSYIHEIDNLVYVSAASAWEITTKNSLGKLPEAVSVAKNVPLWIKKAGFQSLPITPEHAQLAGAWKVSHRDPFDRMLAAQANLENIPLASIDKAMALFPIEILCD